MSWGKSNCGEGICRRQCWVYRGLKQYRLLVCFLADVSGGCRNTNGVRVPMRLRFSVLQLISPRTSRCVCTNAVFSLYTMKIILCSAFLSLLRSSLFTVPVNCNLILKERKRKAIEISFTVPLYQLRAFSYSATSTGFFFHLWHKGILVLWGVFSIFSL